MKGWFKQDFSMNPFTHFQLCLHSICNSPTSFSSERGVWLVFKIKFMLFKNVQDFISGRKLFECSCSKQQQHSPVVSTGRLLTDRKLSVTVASYKETDVAETPVGWRQGDVRTPQDMTWRSRCGKSLCQTPHPFFRFQFDDQIFPTNMTCIFASALTYPCIYLYQWF